MLRLEGYDIWKAFCLEFINQSLTIIQQASSVKDHIVSPTSLHVEILSSTMCQLIGLLWGIFFQTCIGGVQPEVVISENELINDGDVKLRQLLSKFLHNHLADALVELSTDVETLLTYVRDEWLLENH